MLKFCKCKNKCLHLQIKKRIAMSEAIVKDEATEKEDDVLNIPRDESSRSFNCEETTQSKLMNSTFWVVDFIEDVPTRFSKQKGKAGQTLVKIKPQKDAPEREARKFFTGSADILYVLKKIKEMKKFPRRVTMRGNGNRFYFE